MIAKSLRRLSLRGMSVYAQKMKQAWAQDPTLVHQDWDRYFKSGVDVSPSVDQVTYSDDVKGKELALSAYFLIRYYRQRGHEEANLDPLSKSMVMQI